MWPAAKLKRFRANLLRWFGQQKRDLPWRRTKDPYAIWVSEIMLQQTRVAAAIPYFERFLTRFPNCAALAAASEDDVLRHWAGLGYYYRARNLQKAAALICGMGRFPSEHAAILGLPGVGDYTAAAVASIAFDLPHAVVDGNVVRVISRLFAVNVGRKQIAEFADGLLDRARPGDFNQAMMELGATICLPKNPKCLLCPVAKMCRARELGAQDQFPVAKVKAENVAIERTLFWIERNGKMLAWQRPPDSRLMPGFWELPEKEQLPGAAPIDEMGAFRHGITVNSYRIKVWRAAVPADLGNCRWVEMHELDHLPLSTIFKKALKIGLNPHHDSHVLGAVVGKY
jgi:A/G-specific adenine glycosylase